MKLDVIGKRFHRLLIFEPAGRSANKSLLVRCRCDCGTVRVVRLCSLVRSEIKSCGCWRRAFAAAQKAGRTHGLSHSGTYGSWVAMKCRCTNSKHVAYKHYGGRGIAVCARWFESFENFLADMGDRPLGFTLDRINPDGDYEPGNCRWVLPKIQGNNRRSNRLLNHHGISLTLSEWADLTGLKKTTLRERLRRGWSLERALQ